MRISKLTAAVVASCISALLSASCGQESAETSASDGTAAAEAASAEAIGEAEQAAYEDSFHFVVNVKDDGRDKAGGWQKATTVLKFADWRHSLLPYLWQCPIVVGMPIRSERQGRISARYAAQITAEVATEVAHDVMHSRESWRGQGVLYCEALYAQMRRMFNGPRYGIGATVARQ